MALYSSDFLFKDLNKEAEEILGYSKNQALDKSILEINASGGFNIDQGKLNSLLKGERKSYTIRRGNLSKSQKYQALTTTVIADGLQKHIIGVFHKNNEEPIDLSFISKEFGNIERILSLNPDLHYIMDIDSKEYVYQNVNILNYFGYTAQDVGNSNTIEFLISKIDQTSIKDVALANQKFKTEKSIGEFVEVEYKFLSKHDGWKWLKAKTTPLKQDKQASKVNLSYGIIQDITEMKKIEEELFSQKTLIDNVAQLVPDIIQVVDLNSLENIYNNFSGKTFLGYTEKDWSDNDSSGIKLDFLDVIKNHSDKMLSLNDEEVFTIEIAYQHLNGKENWISLKFKIFKRDEEGKPIQILSIISDIQDYKSTVEKLDQSEKITKTIVHAIPDLLLTISKEGVYKTVMPGVNFSLNNPGEIVGKHVSDILGEKLSTKILKLIQECLKTGKTSYLEFSRDYANNEPSKYFSNYFSKLNENEVLVIVRDETEKKKAQMNIDEQVRLLSVQNEQLENFIEKNLELEQFAYIISHDLKEPLRSINAISELIDIEVKHKGNEKLEKLLGHLSENSTRMISLIEGVLEYSKIDANLEFQEIDLSNIVESVLRDLDKSIQDKFIKIEVSELPKPKGDKVQLRQLFQNLLGNAIKFNDSMSPKIEIGAVTKNGEIHYYIKDNGIGVPEHFKESVFKMCKRVHTYLNYPGQGLGLTICKKIVERHGGKLWIEDNEPCGAIFYFTLA